MHLKDAGHRFCISPDRKEGRWLHPAEIAAYHSDWTDVTDWPSEQLVAWLMPAPGQRELFQ